MQRGSDRLNVHHDDEMKHQLKGLLRCGHPTRVQEWYDQEPLGNDERNLAGGAVRTRFELARHLRRTDFPAQRNDLVERLTARHTPDHWVELLERLPERETYRTVQEVVDALGLQERPAHG